MKRAFSVIVAVLLLVAIVGNVYAQVWVRPYFRRDGTFVQGHHRSYPDGNPYNNWSFPGNVNPYTGKVAPGDPDRYLDRYYDRQLRGWSTPYRFDLR